MAGSNVTSRSLTAPWPDTPPTLTSGYYRKISDDLYIGIAWGTYNRYRAWSFDHEQEFDTYEEAKAWLEAMLLTGL